MILVADRGLLSLDNLAALQAVRLASGQALEFILAVLGRRYAEFAEVLATFTQIQCQATTTEVIGGLPWQDLRLAVAHDPLRATQQTQRRNEQIQGLTTQGEQWTGKTRASPTGAASSRTAAPPARFFLALREARLSRIIKVDLQEHLSSYQIDEPARAQAELLDGKSLLVTNTSDLSAPEIVSRYQSLADIERGFRVLKSELEIGPVYHRLPKRIRAPAMLCFLALMLCRVMRPRLNAAETELSPERALDLLRRIQHQTSELMPLTRSPAYPRLGINKPRCSMP